MDKDGVFSVSNGVGIDLCGECHSALVQARVPKFALKNGLYRGHLPPQFADLTWIEEMVCSIYRNTAFVIRLFDSSSESVPRVFKGNTCAHEMNFLSTAKCLPRTPEDINGMISVVLVGTNKFDPAKACDIFNVRRSKIRDFLAWLQAHNLLYRDIPLHDDIIDLYPEDGLLPGLADAVIHN
ncbi:hypothetical protein M422DRAFT_192898, partial [Sphaerobolus stellatus SS14]